MIEQSELDDLYSEMDMRVSEALDYLMLRTKDEDEDNELTHADGHTLIRHLVKSIRHTADRIELDIVDCEECGHDDDIE